MSSFDIEAPCDLKPQAGSWSTVQVQYVSMNWLVGFMLVWPQAWPSAGLGKGAPPHRDGSGEVAGAMTSGTPPLKLQRVSRWSTETCCFLQMRLNSLG